MDQALAAGDSLRGRLGEGIDLFHRRAAMNRIAELTAEETSSARAGSAANIESAIEKEQ